MSCNHLESLDPRMAGQCCKCGRPIPTDEPHGGVGRDPEYERLYLEQVVREATRQFGVHPTAYPASVRQRLALGAERYGDDDFLRKDMIRELLEETPDIAAYCVLESQKTLTRGVEPSSQRMAHLFEASVHAAAADAHARLARLPD